MSKEKSIRIQRLERIAFERASSVVLFELADPRLTNVSLTRAELSNDLSHVILYWSVLGGQADRNKVEKALKAATRIVQTAIAKKFDTRKCPLVQFKFDPSIEGAIRVTNLIDKLVAESKERAGGDGGETPPAAEEE